MSSQEWKYYHRGYYETRKEPYGLVLEPLPWTGPEKSESVLEIKDPGAWVRGTTTGDLEIRYNKPEND